jgi:hypothetical protein
MHVIVLAFYLNVVGLCGSEKKMRLLRSRNVMGKGSGGDTE